MGKRKRDRTINRPFDPAVIARARDIARRYGLVVRYEPDDGAYAASVIELPLVVAFGDTADEAARDAMALAETTAAYMIEQGQSPPSPGAESSRTEQVNFRLTVEEKARLEAAAQRQGLTLVDFIRASAIAVGQIRRGVRKINRSSATQRAGKR